MAKSKDDTPWDELPEVMKPEQVQQKIQISRATFFRLVQSGKLPGAKKVGDSWRIDRDQLRAYFQGEEVTAESKKEVAPPINLAPGVQMTRPVPKNEIEFYATWDDVADGLEYARKVAPRRDRVPQADHDKYIAYLRSLPPRFPDLSEGHPTPEKLKEHARWVEQVMNERDGQDARGKE